MSDTLIQTLDSLTLLSVDLDEKDNQGLGEFLIELDKAKAAFPDDVSAGIGKLCAKINDLTGTLILRDIDPVDNEQAIFDAIAQAIELLNEYFRAPDKRSANNARIEEFLGALLPEAADQPPAPPTAKAEEDLFASDSVEDDKSYISDLTEDEDTDEEDDDIFLDFLQEANEYVQELENEVIELESEPKNKTIINNVFRPFHTLKGVSGFMGLMKLNMISHETETLLDMARNDKLNINEKIIQGVLASLDTIKFIITKLSPENRVEEISQERVEKLIHHLRHLGTEGAKEKHNGPSEPAEAVSIEDLTDFTDTPQEPGKKTKDTVVKVRTHKLDYLIDMVGELVINANLVSQDRHLRTITEQEFVKKLGQLNRTVSELQSASMAMRMVPIGATFTKMKRVVRDYTHKSGKSIELVLRGEDTEIDRNIVDSLYDPLVHMIRNSCDHGIEDAETRAAAGKPAQGVIELHAYHKGNHIVIDVKDDGKGLDRDKIYKKALERGLARKNEQYIDKQIFGFVMEAGFSTADKITNVSGRGVGMDVVNQTLKNLGGRVDIESKAGQGSVFSINLPLTLAIIEGMIVRVGEELFIVPVVNVKRTIQPRAENVNTIAGKNQSYDLGDHLIPIAKLHKLFNITDAKTKWDESILIIVSGNDGREFGLQVDGLVGIQDVVIKTLGEKFKNLRGVSGATIMGDGSVGLILDIGSLVEASTQA